jgi:hypothetical protein
MGYWYRKSLLQLKQSVYRKLQVANIKHELKAEEISLQCHTQNIIRAREIDSKSIMTFTALKALTLRSCRKDISVFVVKLTVL